MITVVGPEEGEVSSSSHREAEESWDWTAVEKMRVWRSERVGWMRSVMRFRSLACQMVEGRVLAVAYDSTLL